MCFPYEETFKSFRDYSVVYLDKHSLTGSTECMGYGWLHYCLFILIHGSHISTLANHIHGDTLMQRINTHLSWYQLTKMCGNF